MPRSNRMSVTDKGSEMQAQLQQRVQPTQKRAKETIRVILEAAAELLETTSIDTFNTNMLAKHANVLVRSVYRYFPNKFAVIAAVWEKMVDEWDEWLIPSMEKLSDPDCDIWVALDSMHPSYLRWLSARKGSWAVRRAIQATPELLYLEAWAEDVFVNKLATALQQRGGTLSRSKLKKIATIYYRCANGVLHTDFALYGKVRKGTTDEFNHMLRSYLASYWEDGAAG